MQYVNELDANISHFQRLAKDLDWRIGSLEVEPILIQSRGGGAGYFLNKWQTLRTAPEDAFPPARPPMKPPMAVPTPGNIAVPIAAPAVAVTGIN